MESNNGIPMPLNGPAELLPSLRRLRHIKKIMANHLRRSNEYLYDTFFTLHEDLGKSDLPDPFYISEIITNSANPQWRPLFFEDKNLQTKKYHSKFVICVWEGKETSLNQIICTRIDMCELTFIGTLEVNFPKNTLIFELHDGLYTTKQVRDYLEEANIIRRNDNYIDQENTKKTSSSRVMLIDMIKKRLEIERKMEIAKYKSLLIEEKINCKKLYFEQLKERNDKIDECQLMESEYQYQYTLYTKRKKEYKERKMKIEKKKESLLQAKIALESFRNDLYRLETKVNKEEEQLDIMKYFIERHISRLIHNLSKIYVIEKTDVEDLYTINGLLLPNTNYEGQDEEDMAAALGHVCHLTNLLSKYLDVPLKYTIISMLSRSQIVDNIKNEGTYPLYSKAQEYENFAYGVFLLNKNIEQLVNSQGMTISNLRNTLPNLKMLIDNFVEKDLQYSKKEINNNSTHEKENELT